MSTNMEAELHIHMYIHTCRGEVRLLIYTKMCLYMLGGRGEREGTKEEKDKRETKKGRKTEAQKGVKRERELCALT